jgi:hypothetical protein
MSLAFIFTTVAVFYVLRNDEPRV